MDEYLDKIIDVEYEDCSCNEMDLGNSESQYSYRGYQQEVKNLISNKTSIDYENSGHL